MNQRLVIFQETDQKEILPASPTIEPIFTRADPPLLYTHVENQLNDYKRQPLMIPSLSYSGPRMAKGDVNGDKKDDLFIGGAKGQPGKLFIQSNNGKFREAQRFDSDASHEDTDAVFFDADGDLDMDLYVGSGGYDDFSVNDSQLQDRIYFNNGLGVFTRNLKALPQFFTSTSCVRQADFDKDGDIDLFVGSRVIPGRYPESPASHLLVNNGVGHFSFYEASHEMLTSNLITDAAWTDLNKDGFLDLILVGEWMPIQVWINLSGKFSDSTIQYFDRDYTGWWNCLTVADLNNDGEP
jgi:enediyne biosynthesis protein E4